MPINIKLFSRHSERCDESDEHTFGSQQGEGRGISLAGGVLNRHLLAIGHSMFNTTCPIK